MHGNVRDGDGEDKSLFVDGKVRVGLNSLGEGDEEGDNRWPAESAEGVGSVISHVWP